MRNPNKRATIVQRLLPAVLLAACCSLSSASHAQDFQSVDTRPTGIGAMLQFHVALGGDVSDEAKPVWSLSAGTTRQTTYDSDGLDFGYKPGIGVAFEKNAPATLALGAVDARQSFADQQTSSGQVSDASYTDETATPHAERAAQP